MLKIQFEQHVTDYMAEVCCGVVEAENSASDDDDSRLDHVAYHLRQLRDLFVYRGGNHVAIHFRSAEGESGKSRVAIITASYQ